MKIKSAIREMFSGYRGTYNQVKASDYYKESEKKMFAAVDAFLLKLDEDQQKSFDDAYIHIMDKNSEYAIDNFTEGFKFGLLMGMEVAGNEDMD